jgi:hypothetical protein
MRPIGDVMIHVERLTDMSDVNRSLSHLCELVLKNAPRLKCTIKIGMSIGGRGGGGHHVRRNHCYIVCKILMTQRYEHTYELYQNAPLKQCSITVFCTFS